jgi:hypothetical protein
MGGLGFSGVIERLALVVVVVVVVVGCFVCFVSVAWWGSWCSIATKSSVVLYITWSHSSLIIFVCNGLFL